MSSRDLQRVRWIREQIASLCAQRDAAPGDPVVRMRLAEALEKGGYPHEAIGELRTAAQNFLRLGFTRRARTAFCMILERVPNDPEAIEGYRSSVHAFHQQSRHQANVRTAVLRLADDAMPPSDPNLELTPTREDSPTEITAFLRPDKLSASERRRAPRIIWPARIDLFDGRRILEARGSDVSTTGIFVEATELPDSDVPVKITIQFPDQAWIGTGTATITRLEAVPEIHGGIGLTILSLDGLTMRHLSQRIAAELGVSPRVIRHIDREARKSARLPQAF